MIRSIKVCAGIGDNVWLLQKLINAGEQFNFQIPDGKPQRGKQIFDMLPQVAQSAEYVAGLSYRELASKTVRDKLPPAGDFYLSCNEWLESGKHLKDWMPSLPISYKIPWQIDDADLPKGKFIGIYGSAYSMQRAWKQHGAWGVKEWLQLIELIHKKNKTYKFVIIGAEWDNDFASELTSKLSSLKIPYINTIGEPLNVVMNWMKHFKYAFYFPSGLPILSETIEGSSDCCMFYTRNIKKILGNFCDHERMQSGKFKECLFCDPVKIFDWCIDNNKL